ncbi:MAG: PQQ-dependent sugar dehydrogenase [Planctomycetes bacterium]|nr:PQQ-dependent sugar dehydrogenase [Planctomycetota bacterium]
MHRATVLLLTFVLAAASCREVRPGSLDARFELVDAFPGTERFLRPLVFTACAPGGRDHVVAEQAGLVWTFELERANGAPRAPRAGERRVFLDLTADVTTRGNEEGLLGLAFHPRFPDDPRVFVYYSPVETSCTRLSAFTVASRAPLAADPSSERVLLEIEQPYANHNGGALAFGPDGWLHVGVGDGGSQGDPGERAQDPRELLGKVLRIDVDHAEAPLAYGVDRAPPFPEGRPEVWALGLRNPWRFAFDDAGRLWCGDVGQDRFEEVVVLTRGANGGWPRREGLELYRSEGPRGPGAPIDPALVYDHDEGESITGGIVYASERLPALRGAFLFADYLSGRVWWTETRGDGPRAKHALANAPSVASFGTDAWGEPYLCCFDGRIRTLVPAPSPR